MTCLTLSSTAYPCSAHALPLLLINSKPDLLDIWLITRAALLIRLSNPTLWHNPLNLFLSNTFDRVARCRHPRHNVRNVKRCPKTLEATPVDMFRQDIYSEFTVSEGYQINTWASIHGIILPSLTQAKIRGRVSPYFITTTGSDSLVFPHVGYGSLKTEAIFGVALIYLQNICICEKLITSRITVWNMASFISSCATCMKLRMQQCPRKSNCHTASLLSTVHGSINWHSF